jgi:predicted ATPase
MDNFNTMDYSSALPFDTDCPDTTENLLPSSHAQACQGIKILIENLINDNDENTELFMQLELKTLPKQVLDYHRLFSSLSDDQGNYTEIIALLRVLMIENYEGLFDSDDGNDPWAC